jgi:hypothetical protein
MSGTFYNLNTKYNWLLALFNSLPSAGDIMTLSTAQVANGLKIFNILPQSSVAPLVNDDLTNKLYVDTVAGGGSQNLDQVLGVGNDGGGQDIVNLNNIDLVTINGSAYPPTTIDCIDTVAPTVMYPVMTNGLGIQPTEIMNSNPFTLVPSTGQFEVRNTMFVEGVGLNRNVAIGADAGSSIGVAISDTIAIGGRAGSVNQQNFGIAIGSRCGETLQGQNSIAIGVAAGRSIQGADAVAIGTSAGIINQHRNTIVLSALGSATPLNTNGNFACFIAPIRGAALGIGVGVMKYDPATFEVTYSTT